MLQLCLACLVLLTIVVLPMAGAGAADPAGKPVVVLDTSHGPITIELDRDKAPITVDNFLKYVDAGFYDGTVFHRVIPGFMIQGGGMTDDEKKLTEKGGTRAPIQNESANGLKNLRGTLAMARTNDPNSATAQFFINLTDNASLDGGGRKPGYAVFGKVIGGMDAVDAIAKVPTTDKLSVDGRQNGDVPEKPVTIKSAKRKP